VLEFFRARPSRDECRHRPTATAERQEFRRDSPAPVRGSDADALGFTHVVVQEAGRNTIFGAVSAGLAGRKMQCAQGG
jgi:hypothetical protein